MKNYESPVILDNEELTEGVYATGSGGSSETCFTNHVDWKRVEGTDYWNITVTAWHHATHSTEGLVLVLSFGTIVTLETYTGGSLDSGKTGSVLRIKYKIHYDQTGENKFDILVNSSNSIYVTAFVECDRAKGI